MSNVEEIVRSIIDNLSDGVAELVLMVVVLAEQNQPMPAHLPTASNAVNSTAEKLAKIAKTLAKQDYAQFPSIANEITEAASAVESATSVLGGAISNLQGGGDRKKGWDGLVDACRVMSGKTIRLLHIIYGAPLQRLLLNSDNLADAIDQFDAKPPGLDNVGNQQKVLDNLKPITDNALRMQKHLLDRAKNADNPHAKAALEKAAQDVRDKAQALVNAVNDGFNDPSHADFSKPLQDLKDAVQEGRNVAQRTAPPAPPSLQNAGPKNLEDAIERAKAAARDIPVTARDNPKNFAPANDKVKDAIAEVRKRIEPNPAKPYDWNKEVEVPLAEQYRAAREALRNPNNPAAKQALDKATDDLVRALDDLKPDRRNDKRGISEPSGAPYDGSYGDKGPNHGKGNYVAPRGGNSDNSRMDPVAVGDSETPTSAGAPRRGGPGAAPAGGNKGGYGAPDGSGSKRRHDPSGEHGQRGDAPNSRSGNPNSGSGNRGPNAPPGGSKSPSSSANSPYGKHPTEEQAKQLSDKARKIAEPLTAAINKPEDREQEAYQRLKDALNNARNDVDRKQPKAASAHIKQAADAAKDLAKQFRGRAADPNNGMDDQDREDYRKAADDLDRLVPPFVEKGANANKDLNNDPNVNDFKEAARKLERAADRGLKDPHRDKPLTPKEYDKLKQHLHNAAAAAQRGDQATKKKELDAAKPLVERARNFTVQKGRGLLDPEKPDGPSDELMKLWKKFGASRDPDAMKKMVDDFDDVYKKMNKETGSTPVAAANAVEEAINNLQGAVDSGDARRLAPAAKALQDKYNDLINEVNNNPDPKVKAAGTKAAAALRPMVEDIIKKAADAVQNPKDKQKQAAFENAVPQMKRPLAEFKKDAVPQQDDVLVNENHGAGVKDAQAKLRDALARGEPEKIRKAVDDLKRALGTYNDHAKAMVDQRPPAKKPYLDDKLADLEHAADKLERLDTRSPDAIERMVDTIPAAVDEFEDELHSDSKDDAIKAAAKANNLAAFINDIDEDEMDLGDLLATAGELSDLMRGMVGNTATVAEQLGSSEQPLTDASNAALDLGDLLASLEGGWADPATVSEQIKSKMESIRAPSNPSGSSPFDQAPTVSLDRARSFEDIAQAVAWKIHQQSQEMQNPSKTGDNVALELAHLAAAARGGEKQKLLLSAKAAAAQIQAFAKELTDLANKIPAKTPREREVQEHLLRCATGLKNYSMHLKILSSVKAASIEQSRDTDESLSTIARDLGDLISQSLGSMRVVYTTMKI